MATRHNMKEIEEITLRWARHANRVFPKWEVNELHNEAFIIAMKLIEAGRYKPEKGALSTFLWHALPLDVRHRYRLSHGQRYLTDTDGKRRYRTTEQSESKLSAADKVEFNTQESDWDGRLCVIEVSSKWVNARSAGFTASDLRRRGMSYAEQRQEAQELRNEQQIKRSER